MNRKTLTFEWKTSTKSGKTIHVDRLDMRFHVREKDNRVAIVLSCPGWAVQEPVHDYWYVSVEHLTNSGWEHQKGSTSEGRSFREAMEVVKDKYDEEVGK